MGNNACCSVEGSSLEYDSQQTLNLTADTKNQIIFNEQDKQLTNQPFKIKSVYSRQNSESTNYSENLTNLDSASEPEVNQVKSYGKTAYQWLERYKKGDDVEIAFPNGDRLKCILNINIEKNQLQLCYENKRRPINFNEIYNILYKGNYTNIEPTESVLLRNPSLIGLRLKTSNKAIALVFPSEVDCQYFVDFLNKNCKNLNSFYEF